MNAQSSSDEAVSSKNSPRLGGAEWLIYRGTGRPIRDGSLPEILPPAPPWRNFHGAPPHDQEVPPEDEGETERRLGSEFNLSAQDVDPHEVEMVNAALYLRRPLLVTGRPGTGKSSLAYRIAKELRLGRVLRWAITSHTTLKAGQYSYDAIGRAQAAATGYALSHPNPDQSNGSASPRMEPPIGQFIQLGVLGTAFLPRTLPRVLLIDELDKSEADLPNDLLSIFEDGEFMIPELERVHTQSPEVSVFTADPEGRATIIGGRVRCRAFPIVVITSNGEREFPPAFLRRCLRFQTRELNADQLAAMVSAHLANGKDALRQRLIEDFVHRSAASGGLPTDKLLDAIYLATSGAYTKNDAAWSRLVDALWQQLSSSEAP